MKTTIQILTRKSLKPAIAIMLSLLLLYPIATNALEPVKWNQRYQNYIDQYKDIAICEMLQHDIPASITMAQGLLESGAGMSELSRKGNNHFGIKCHDWTGPSMTKDDDARNECFRVYDTALESYEDHSLFLLRPRYRSLFSLSRTDYVGWAKGLKKCGYATNPSYAQLLIDIIRCYNLDKLDRATSFNAANIKRTGKYMAQLPTQYRKSNISLEHIVYMNNKNYYVIARNGDSFRSIAKEFDLSYRKIAGYNERDKKEMLHAGDIVYLEKKRKKADKKYKKHPHTVEVGESMYDIAQRYGIRLKYLYKKNKLSPDYMPQVGDQLRVY